MKSLLTRLLSATSTRRSGENLNAQPHRTASNWRTLVPVLTGATLLLMRSPASGQDYHSNDLTPAAHRRPDVDGADECESLCDRRRGEPRGRAHYHAGVFKGSIILNTAPTQATVWNSLGGMATVPVTLKTSSTATGGGGGGGGGGSTTTTYKLSISLNGKGSVATSPAAASYASGTVVTLPSPPPRPQARLGSVGQALFPGRPTPPP